MPWWLDVVKWIALALSVAGAWIGWHNARRWNENRRAKERLALFESISSLDERERIDALDAKAAELDRVMAQACELLETIRKHPERFVRMEP